MTIEQYLSGKVDFNINENTISAILYDRNVAEGTAVNLVSEKQKDLCLADLYVFVANSSTSSSSEYESDGGWQRQKSAKNIHNRAGWLEMANALYAKWGVEPTSPSGLVLKNLY